MKLRYAAGLLIFLALSFFAGRYFSHGPTAQADNAHRLLYYTDPMHPDYKSDRPGIAPDCGMQLEPVYADGHGSELAGTAPGSVLIEPEKQALIGMRLATVERSSSRSSIRVLGRVSADESRVHQLVAPTEGYIQEISAASVGTVVKAGERLATFGSPEVIVAQQAFLQSASRLPETKNEAWNQNDWRRLIVKTSGERLRSMGMTDEQIKDIAATGMLTEVIPINSPVAGVVIAKGISPKQRVERGAELYRVAELNRVWVLADVYESEAQYFKPGMVAKLRLPGQGATLSARVSSALPQLDPATRTLKLRLEAENPGFALRPDMFVDVEMPVHLPEGLSVPVDALLDSGNTKRVFVSRGKSVFEPHAVKTGWRFGDRVEIVEGLREGDQVVAAGSFLVDSESRLRAPEAARSHGSEAATKDPVCGMTVDPVKSAEAGNKVSYRGADYYFCSKTCRESFLKDRDRYAPAPANTRLKTASMPGTHEAHSHD